MTRLYLVKTNGGDLIGWGPNDNAYLHKLGDGECIECDTKKARNPKHHAKFFALLQSAYVNQNKYGSIKALLIELKLRAEWYDEHVTHDGRLVFVPRSISWAQMGQQEFDRFYGDALIALALMFPDNANIVAEADEIIAKRESTDFAGAEMEIEA